MPRKRIGKEPLTGAEKQARFRNRQRINMDYEQEKRATDKLWRELRDILDTLPDHHLYAIAPILRFMKYSKAIHDKISEYELSESIQDIDISGLDLSSYPGATFNRDEKENAEIEAAWAEDD